MDSFLKRCSEESSKKILGVQNSARQALYRYDWPGNIRELQNCIESAVVMCSGNEIALEDLPPTISRFSGEESISVPMGLRLDEAEKIIIRENLAFNNGNKTQTAQVLGIERKTLAKKIDE